MKHSIVLALVLLSGAALGCADSSPTTPTPAARSGGGTLGLRASSAGYSAGAAYQIEISSNINGNNGGGIWLWIELTPAAPGATSGTGNYSGSDCGHGPNAGAIPDGGDVTWSESGGMLTITGVTLSGLGGFPVTLMLPASYGHSTSDFATTFPAVASLLGIPSGVGTTQLQIAP